MDELTLLAQLAEFFTAPGRWSYGDPSSIPFRVVQHLQVALTATASAVIVAMPPALWLAHQRRLEALASAVVNLGRAIPSFGLIVLFWLLAVLNGLPSDFWPLVAALVALAIPPIFTNTYTAVREVDPDTAESARGMGYEEVELLIDVELPMASPVILAGVRIALVQVIATVTIGAIVTNGGGLGRYVVDGFALGVRGHGEVLAGAILIGVLVLAAEAAFGLAERAILPAGIRRKVRTADIAERTGAAG